jgi:hypothetical protein
VVSGPEDTQVELSSGPVCGVRPCELDKLKKQRLEEEARVAANNRRESLIDGLG